MSPIKLQSHRNVEIVRSRQRQILALLIRTLLFTILVSTTSKSIHFGSAQANENTDEINRQADDTQTNERFRPEPTADDDNNNSSSTTRSSHRNAWSDRNVSELRQTQSLGPEQQFVAGGASSLQPPNLGNHRGRLVDRIASPSTSTSTSSVMATTTTSEKLDYIIEFMRQNKLSKFCDLLTNQQNDLIQREVVRRLNSMAQFTLFVPTNEALLIQPASHSFEQLRSQPEEAAKFLLSHATSELVVPKMMLMTQPIGANNNIAASGQFQSSLVYSLANSPLRVSTLQQQNQGAMSGSRLELIVNGANVIPGHSYALQEPNNANATHAIVHLIDRSLYPSPSENLLDLMRQVAPTMAQLIDLAATQQPASSLLSSPTLDMRKFRERLQSTEGITTFFAPTEEAFKATPVKLLDQLHTNRTFLQQFLRNHMVKQEEIFFKGHLASISNNNNQLISASGDKLEFEAKSLQNRQLVVVNAVPIIISDLMATNGVLHLTSRPLFAPNLLDDCQCGSSSLGNRPGNSEVDGANIFLGSGRVQQPNQILGTLATSASSNSLERESSPLQQQQRQAIEANHNQASRAQRSNKGKLPIGADRSRVEFYRPSIEPANLKLVQPISTGGEPLGFVESRTPSAVAQITQQNPIQHQVQQQSVVAGNTLQPISVVPNYEVTLNATTRQKLRAEQLKLPPASQKSHLFAYDEPLDAGKQANQSSATKNETNFEGDRLKRPYLAGLVEPSPIVHQQQQQNHQESLNMGREFLTRGESAKREQRLLKFQPEDARDASQLQLSQEKGSNGDNNFTSSPLMTSNQLQPAYDYVTSPAATSSKLHSALRHQQQQQVPTSFSCAFYDSECNRMMSRLVRLPPSGNKKSINGLKVVNPNVTAAYDTTFNSGEPTSTSQMILGSSRQQQQHQQQLASTSRYVLPVQTGRQVSVLNQPLPPLSSDESSNLRQLAGANHQWRIQDADINRIVTSPSPAIQGKDTNYASSRLVDPNNINYAHGFTSGISRQNNSNSNASMVLDLPRAGPNAPLRQAQILFVPVKLVNDTISRHRFNNLSSSSSSPSVDLSPTTMTMNLPGNVLVFSQASSTQAPNSQYLAPIQPMMQLQGSSSPSVMHQNHNYNNELQNNNYFGSSRSNLTLADDSVEGFDVPMGADLHNNNSSSFANNQPTAKQQQSNLNQKANSRLVKQAQFAQQANSVPLTPALAHRKQQQQVLQQQQNQFNQNSYQSDIETLPGSVKWPGASQPLQQQIPLGDFSVTSARLTDPLTGLHRNLTSGGLATQASDHQQLSLHNNQPQSHSQQQPATSADYFQDRTISEIMDDSGLRIDGQLVTFKRLKQCLSAANLLSLASQTGNSLTIFMPTDQAFQRLVQLAFGQRQSQQLQSQSQSQQQQQQAAAMSLPLVIRAPPSEDSTLGGSDPSAASLGALDRLTLDCQAPIVRQMLLDHISARLITPKQLASDTSIASLSGRQLILSSVPSKQIVVVDGQPVLAATRAKNGMVYVINKFLNLTQQMPNVIDLMQTQADLSTFVAYMRQNNNQLSERLKRETGPVTILAPTNDAFDQLSPTARQLFNSDPAALMDILRGHVLEGAQFGKLISMRAKLNTMNKDQRIEAKVIKPNVYMLDNQMTSMRLVGTAANGVVNAIDRVIVPAWLRNSISPSATSARTLPSQLTPPHPNLDTSASANSGAATLARQRLHLVEPGLRFRPDLAHGNADIIFRNHNVNNNNNSPKLPSLNSNNRFSGENFLQFGSARQANNGSSIAHSSSSSSSSSNLAGDSPSILKDSTNLNSSRFSSVLSNELEGVNNSNISSLTSKNMILIEKLANLMQARRFLKLLLNSRAHELLKPDMNYVILVPTDQAIERLPGQILNLLEQDSERLSDLINYHIIDTTFDYINTIPDGQTLQTLNEKDILFNWHRNNTILTVSGAIVLGGIQEENIALLIVDRVLYPTPGDLLAIVNKSPILSNFTTIIKNAGLDGQLTRAGPYTLFAPSDQAFSQLDKSDLEFLQRNKEIARRFLLRHLSTPMLFTSSIALSSNMTTRVNNNNNMILSNLVPSVNITNSLGEDLILRQRNDYFSVNDINFSYADVAASNGVLHVIDGLL